MQGIKGFLSSFQAHARFGRALKSCLGSFDETPKNLVVLVVDCM
jgi:hypothetical protein